MTKKMQTLATWNAFTDGKRGAIAKWLSTPPGMWPETVQAYRQAIDACPNPFMPRDFMNFIPRERWHPERRS